VELRQGIETPSERELISFCRERLTHCKCPVRIVYCVLPKTGTGKIQKFRLRTQAGSREADTKLSHA
jgi:fatty-acyl-CoA synthase